MYPRLETKLGYSVNSIIEAGSLTVYGMSNDPSGKLNENTKITAKKLLYSNSWLSVWIIAIAALIGGLTLWAVLNLHTHISPTKKRPSKKSK